MTELHPWSPVVEITLPITVSLARIGAARAEERLLAVIDAAELEDMRFLLEAIGVLKSPAVLASLAGRSLSDKRETVSRGKSYLGGKRRLCDDAVDAFVERLNLKVTFPLLEAGRYSEKQLEEVRRRVKETIARDLRSCYAYNEHSIGGEGGIILIAVRLHLS